MNEGERQKKRPKMRKRKSAKDEAREETIKM